MIMNLIERHVIAIFLCSTFFALCFSSSPKVMFADCGQGNLSVVLQDNYALNCPAVIIDAGSTSYKKFRGASFKKDLIARVAKNITTYLTKIDDKKIIVVASHPDIDHYDWLHEIIAACIEEDADVFVEKIYLGGCKAYYKNAKNDESFFKYLNECEEEDESPVQFLADTANKDTVTTIFSGGDTLYYIMPALYATKNVDSNDTSLVVVIKCNDFVMPIMGDATEETIKHIEKYPNNERPLFCPNGSTILSASHHGAEKHGCNSVSLMGKIKAKAVVFSSGVNKGLKHPLATVVSRFHSSGFMTVSEHENKWRPLYVGIDGNTQMGIYAKGSLNYGLTVNESRIYSTLTDGTIVVNKSLEGDRYNIVREQNNVRYATKKACIMKVLLAYPRGLLAGDL